MPLTALPLLLGLLVVLGLLVSDLARGGPRAPAPRPGDTEPWRRLRGAAAGLGVAFGGSFVAGLALGAVYLPLAGLQASPALFEGGMTGAQGLGAIVVGTLVLCAVAGWIGASCVAPRRSGAFRAVALVLLAVLAAAATYHSPIAPVTLARPGASAAAALGTFVLGGAALLAWPERPQS